MTDFLIKAAIITFLCVPLGVLVLIFIIGCVIGVMEDERKRELEDKR